MADIREPMLPADDYSTITQTRLTKELPLITAEEAFSEFQKRCANGMQYATFPNRITDEQKAILETAGYIVTRNTVPGDVRYGEGDLYIGFQIALNERAAEEAMQITPNGSGGDTPSAVLAANLRVNLDSSTFVLSIQLLNMDGEPIGDEQVVDLPIEATVVDGRYDSNSKSLVLVLKSGSEITIPIADLIAGLQAEITAQNKLSSDLVDDTNATNKFVTAAEKAQIATNTNDISDLQSTIGNINSVLEEVL